MSRQQFLSDHAAKGNTHQQTGSEVERPEKRGSILRVVGHRIRTIGRIRLPEATLVKREHFEMLCEWAIKDARLVA